MSANNQVNESVARLIQWSDETLLMQENEGHEILKENTAQVVQEVIDAVKVSYFVYGYLMQAMTRFHHVVFKVAVIKGVNSVLFIFLTAWSHSGGCCQVHSFTCAIHNS